MRLKKHISAAALHSQLSAILEKLMISAVEEIKELVFDFCEEISREKPQNSDLCDSVGQDQEGRLFDTPASFYREPQDASNESYEQMTPTTSSREDAKEKHGGEQSYVKVPVTNEFEIGVQRTLTPNCKFEQTATAVNATTNAQEDDCSHDGSKQSSGEPPEDSKDQLIDYNSPDETQSTPYDDFSTNQSHGSNVEFHIKQEEETPAFETGRNTDDIHSNVEQGMSFDNFPARFEEAHDPPALDNPAGPILDFFPFPLPDQQMNAYISNQETPFASHSEFRLPPSKQVKKYTCDFCNKKFCYPSDLKHHRLWHTRERTHVCQICGKAFITRSHLRRHEVMHLDVQPSVCQICGYKTSRSVYLKEHMKTHAKRKHV